MERTLSIRLDRLNELKALVEFKPPRTVLALVSNRDQFLSGWMLSRLLGWVFFGQQDRIRTGNGARRPLKFRRAYKAGQTYVWLYLQHWLFGRHPELPDFDNLPNYTEAAAALYFLMDEKRPGVTHGGYGLTTLLNQEGWKRDLLYVNTIVDFLVRANKHKPEVCKAKVARYYTRLIRPGKYDLGASAVEKIWNHYRAVAPYIFAFYSLFFVSGEDSISVVARTEEEWIGQIVRAVQGSQISQRISYAAYAAMLLRKTIKDVRHRDFIAASGIEPPVKVFDENDMNTIESYEAFETQPLA